MKNTQQGFVAYIVIAAIALLAGVGTTMYFDNSEQVEVVSTAPQLFEQASTTVNNSSTASISTTPEKKPIVNEDLKTYSNTKFGFKFNYPTEWKMTGEIGGNYSAPFLFDEILSTDNHPINKAGHVSVLTLTADQILAELKKDTTLKIQSTININTANLVGKKITTISGQQTNYKYILPLGNKALYIDFTSMNTVEGKISKELEKKIDEMIATISSF